MFGGGGFDNNETQNVQQDSSAQKERVYNNKTIPVSIKMLLGAQTEGNSISLEGVQTGQVSLLARITGFEDSGNNLKLSLNDDSGVCEILLYKRNGDSYPKYWNDIYTQKDTNGIYVRVTVNVSVHKNQTTYQCVQMRPVIDQNEQSRFLLDVILRKLQRDQGIKNIDPKAQQQQSQQKQLQQVNRGDSVQNQVVNTMQQLKESNQEQVSVQQLQQNLSHLSIDQIKTTLENLKAEQKVYDVGNQDTYSLID